MTLVPNNTLITSTPEEGRELATMMARQDDRRHPNRRGDSPDTPSILAGQVDVDASRFEETEE